MIKECRGCRFRKDCANQYRANWKDKYKCEDCWFYSKSNELDGYCIVDIHKVSKYSKESEKEPVYKKWCYSGCSQYQKLNKRLK